MRRRQPLDVLWMRLIVALLMLVVANAAEAQVADVDAGQIATQFVCRGQASTAAGGTNLPAVSVSLFVDSGPTMVPVCHELVGDEFAVSFSLPYDPAFPHPELRARAHSAAGCIGEESPPSANACRVTYTVEAPLFLDSSPP